MKREEILEQITRLGYDTARRVTRLARTTQFTAEELLADIAIEARRTLMRQRWGPQAETPKTAKHHPHPSKERT